MKCSILCKRYLKNFQRSKPRYKSCLFVDVKTEINRMFSLKTLRKTNNSFCFGEIVVTIKDQIWEKKRSFLNFLNKLKKKSYSVSLFNIFENLREFLKYLWRNKINFYCFNLFTFSFYALESHFNTIEWHSVLPEEMKM